MTRVEMLAAGASISGFVVGVATLIHGWVMSGYKRRLDAVIRGELVSLTENLRDARKNALTASRALLTLERWLHPLVRRAGMEEDTDQALQNLRAAVMRTSASESRIDEANRRVAGLAQWLYEGAKGSPSTDPSTDPSTPQESPE